MLPLRLYRFTTLGKHAQTYQAHLDPEEFDVCRTTISFFAHLDFTATEPPSLTYRNGWFLSQEDEAGAWRDFADALACQHPGWEMEVFIVDA